METLLKEYIKTKLIIYDGGEICMNNPQKQCYGHLHDLKCVNDYNEKFIPTNELKFFVLDAFNKEQNANISERKFYDILNELNIPKNGTKREPRGRSHIEFIDKQIVEKQREDLFGDLNIVKETIEEENKVLSVDEWFVKRIEKKTLEKKDGAVGKLYQILFELFGENNVFREYNNVKIDAEAKKYRSLDIVVRIYNRQNSQTYFFVEYDGEQHFDEMHSYNFKEILSSILVEDNEEEKIYDQRVVLKKPWIVDVQKMKYVNEKGYSVLRIPSKIKGKQITESFIENNKDFFCDLFYTMQKMQLIVQFSNPSNGFNMIPKDKDNLYKNHEDSMLNDKYKCNFIEYPFYFKKN